MNIENSTITDIDEIFRLYKIATAYQKSKETVVLWPKFQRELINQEITENHQWKIIIDNQIACIWATTFSDEQIWEEKNSDPAIYIHRIATNPDFRGHNFVTKIVEWAKEYAQKAHKKYIRLDTIGNNEKLIAHYKKSGFDFLGFFDLKNTQGLPEHYKQGPVCLFEINLTVSANE